MKLLLQFIAISIAKLETNVPKWGPGYFCKDFLYSKYVRTVIGSILSGHLQRSGHITITPHFSLNYVLYNNTGI